MKPAKPPMKEAITAEGRFMEPEILVNAGLGLPPEVWVEICFMG